MFTKAQISAIPGQLQRALYDSMQNKESARAQTGGSSLERRGYVNNYNPASLDPTSMDQQRRNAMKSMAGAGSESCKKLLTQSFRSGSGLESSGPSVGECFEPVTTLTDPRHRPG